LKVLVVGFFLGENLDYKRNNLAIERFFDEEFREVYIVAGRNGVVKYFKFELEGSAIIGFADYIVSRLEYSGIKGTYSVPELNLEEVPFPKVIKAVESYYKELKSNNSF